MAKATTKPRNKKTTQVAISGVRQIYRRPLVEATHGITRSTLYRYIKNGLFTKPVCIGGGRSGWPSDEVAAIRDARIAGKSDDEIKALVAALEAARGAA